ncbi:MAG: hypothetical protein IJB02_02090 [Oscillospiraceae bacterium]|nr:hypothetical protein [Oscillospiraceae bacterium]
MRALLIGRAPLVELGHTYVQQMPYDGVVIGSLELGELVCFSNQPVLEALAEGKPVILYTPGLPAVPQNRALAATLAARQRELKAWGVVFTDGGRKRLITAQEARTMRDTGLQPGPGAVLTPLAKEILEGTK